MPLQQTSSTREHPRDATTVPCVKVDHESGFGVLEAIVALAIAALALGALYRSTGMALRATDRSKQHLQALAQAESHLGTLGITTPLLPGDTGGTYRDGTSWRLKITSLSRAGTPDPAPPMWIVLETFDRSGARLTRLETSKAGPPQQ